MTEGLIKRHTDIGVKNRSEFLPAPGLFGAGLFCLVLGVFFGNKLIAAGHILVIGSLFFVLFDRKNHPVLWKAMPVSGWLLVAFAAIAAVSVFANLSTIENPLDFLKRIRYYLIISAMLLLPSLSGGVMEAIWRRDALVLALLSSMLVSITIGFITLITGRHPFLDNLTPANMDFSRFAGLLGQTINFSYTMQFVVVALAVFFWMPSLWKAMTRIPWWVVIPLLLLTGWCQYLTGSRGAMLGIIGGFVAFSLMRSFKFVFVILAVGVACGGVAYLKSPRYFISEDPARLNMWKTALLCFVEKPVFGIGFRNFEVHSVELKKRYGMEKDEGIAVNEIYLRGHAHNNYLEALASTGIFGAVAFLGFCGLWTREALRSCYACIFVPLIVAFLVSGFFTDTFFDSETLNGILLIYFFSQWIFHREKELACNHSLPAESSDLAEGSGLITTDT